MTNQHGEKCECIFFNRWYHLCSPICIIDIFYISCAYFITPLCSSVSGQKRHPFGYFCTCWLVTFWLTHPGTWWEASAGWCGPRCRSRCRPAAEWSSGRMRGGSWSRCWSSSRSGWPHSGPPADRSRSRRSWLVPDGSRSQSRWACLGPRAPASAWGRSGKWDWLQIEWCLTEKDKVRLLGQIYHNSIPTYNIFNILFYNQGH